MTTSLASAPCEWWWHCRVDGFHVKEEYLRTHQLKWLRWSASFGAGCLVFCLAAFFVLPLVDLVLGLLLLMTGVLIF